MIENRKTYRLPFRGKIIFGNEDRVSAGNATNMSSGGVFVMTLQPFTRGTRCKCVFLIDPAEAPVVAHGIIKRVVASSANVDEKPGFGLEFIGAESADLARIQKFMNESRKNFELAATLLSAGEPDLTSLEPLLQKMHLPSFADIGAMRFYIERVLKSMEMADRASGSV